MDGFGKQRGDLGTAAGSANGSYEQFVRKHFHPLEKSLSLITLDAALAADAAQEACLRLYLRWEEVDKLDDPAAWLYRVGINRCHDYRRQLKRASRLFDRLTVEAGRAQAAPHEPGERWAPDAEFAALVERLSKQQRIAAVLFYQADLSTKEIARVMQISESAVKSHLQRAREALRPLVEVD
jgi:RNA polymerase sigma factor (sigma-70 family)